MSNIAIEKEHFYLFAHSDVVKILLFNTIHSFAHSQIYSSIAM